jgi:hypothetical protein
LTLLLELEKSQRRKCLGDGSDPHVSVQCDGLALFPVVDSKAGCANHLIWPGYQQRTAGNPGFFPDCVETGDEVPKLRLVESIELTGGRGRCGAKQKKYQQAENSFAVHG